VNYDDLVRSATLRSLVLDFNLKLFRDDPNPMGSFERDYVTKRDEEIAIAQRARLSSVYKEIEKNIKETGPHNEQMLAEFREEERGLEGDKLSFDLEAFKR